MACMHEGMPKPRDRGEAEDLVEDLLIQFGALRSVWEKRIEEIDDPNEAVDILREGLQKRSEALTSSSHHSAKVFSNVPAVEAEQNLDIAEFQREALSIARATIADPENMLGFGQTGKVFESPQYPGLCYKFVYDMREYVKWNSIDVEADLLTQLASFSVAGVSTPKPYFFIEESDFVVLAMEKLDGVTVKDVCDHKAFVPKEFDSDAFIQALTLYVTALHEKHRIYHRDLHEGNVLIGNDGTPYVIDFNKSTKKVLSSEDPYRSVDQIHGSITHFTDDFEFVRQLQRLFKEHPPKMRE
jgi:serine/threonine protein kinase